MDEKLPIPPFSNFKQILNIFKNIWQNILIITQRTLSQNPASFLSISLSGLRGFSLRSHHISHKNTRGSCTHNTSKKHTQIQTQNTTSKSEIQRLHSKGQMHITHKRYMTNKMQKETPKNDNIIIIMSRPCLFSIPF